LSNCPLTFKLWFIYCNKHSRSYYMFDESNHNNKCKFRSMIGKWELFCFVWDISNDIYKYLVYLKWERFYSYPLELFTRVYILFISQNVTRIFFYPPTKRNSAVFVFFRSIKHIRNHNFPNTRVYFTCKLFICQRIFHIIETKNICYS
jgi:hypothetical protein